VPSLRNTRTLERFSTRIAPRRFVPFLADWVTWNGCWSSLPAAHPNRGSPLPSGLGRLRELIAISTRLAQMRGTCAA